MNVSETNKYEWLLWKEVISEDQIKEINSICEKYYESEIKEMPQNIKDYLSI